MPVIPHNYEIDQSIKLSFYDIQALAFKIVNGLVMGNAKYIASKNKNALGLEDKIAKVIVSDSEIVDELEFMDGEEIKAGHAIEETYIDYIKSRPFTGEQTTNKYIPTHRPAVYTYFGPRRIMSVSVLSEMNDSGFYTLSEAFDATLKMSQKLYDSYKLERIEFKRALIGKAMSKIDQAYTSATVFDPTKDYSQTTKIDDNTEILTYVKKDEQGSAYGVIVKDYKANTKASWDEAVGKLTDDPDEVEAGYIIPIKIKVPTVSPGTGDTDAQMKKNAEKFIIKLKFLKSKLKNNLSSCNLGGAKIGGGGSNNLVLFLRTGISAYIDIDVLLGAINPSKAATGFKVIEVPSFGKAYDMTEEGQHTLGLITKIDTIKNHKKYFNIRKDTFGEADFENTHIHYRFWPFIKTYTNIVKIVSTNQIPADVFDIVD